MALSLSKMTWRDLPLFNTVRNASREWLHDHSAYSLPEAVEWFRRGQGDQFMVVLLDEVPVGYCRVTDGNEAMEKMVGADIHPDYRGRGFARKVYGLLFSYLRQLGVQKFRLRVLKKNMRARHIYDALGFVQVADAGEEYEMVFEEGAS